MADGYYIPPGASPEEVRRKRLLAEALMMESTSTKPVGHWSQALARVVQGGIGRYQMRKANEGEREGRNSVMRDALALLGADNSGTSDAGAASNTSSAMSQALASPGGEGMLVASGPPTGSADNNLVAPSMARTSRREIMSRLLSNPWGGGLGERLLLQEMRPKDQWEQIRMQDGSLAQRNSRTGQIDVLSRPRDPGASYSTVTDDKGNLWQVNAQTGHRNLLMSAPKPDDDPFAERMQAAQAYGLDPNTPEGKQFILTGKLVDTGAGGLEAQHGKPPAGYRWNPDGTLAAIPGGPGEAISAELAARLGMAESFQADLPGIQETVNAGGVTGAWDAVRAGGITVPLIGTVGQGGRQYEVYRKIESGVDALRRMLTGAGMPVAEANDYVGRYCRRRTTRPRRSAQSSASSHKN